MNTKGVLLGLAAVAVFGLVAGGLISLADFTVNPELKSVVLGFFGAAIGAFIARRDFVLPALGLWLVGWVLVAYLLYSIAAPTGHASFLAIAQINFLSIVLSTLAVAIGALLGQFLANRAHTRAPAI